MTILEIIKTKKAEITQTYADYEQQEANINAEKLRLQGEHRAYEYINEQIEKEKVNATDKSNRDK